MDNGKKIKAYNINEYEEKNTSLFKYDGKFLCEGNNFVKGEINKHPAYSHLGSRF